MSNMGKINSDYKYDDILNPVSIEKKTPLTEKLANKGYKYNDVASKSKSLFTKKRKKRKKK